MQVLLSLNQKTSKLYLTFNQQHTNISRIMKQFFILIWVLFPFFIVSCNQEDNEFNEETPPGNSHVSSPSLERYDTIAVFDTYFHLSFYRGWENDFAKDKSLYTLVDDTRMRLDYGIYHNWDEMQKEGATCSMRQYGIYVTIDTPLFDYRKLDMRNSTAILISYFYRNDYDVESIKVEKQDNKYSMMIQCGQRLNAYGAFNKFMIFLLPEKIDAKDLNINFDIKEEYVEAYWLPIVNQ